MSVYIPITNPSLEDFEKTALSKRHEATDTTLNVFSGRGFGVNQLLLVGNYNEEIAEIVSTHATTTPTDTTITLSAGLKYAHSVNTPIRRTLYNKFKIYRSDDKGVSYTLEATVDISPDSYQTVYISGSGPGALFRITSYNSITGVESTPSDAISGVGLGFASVGYILDRVYDLFADPTQEYIKSDATLLNYLNEGYIDLWTRLAGLGQGYGVKRTGTAIDPDINLVENQPLVNLLDDCITIKKVMIDYDGVGKFVLATYYDPLFKDKDNFYSKSAPRYTLYARKIEIDPAPNSSSGKMRLWYVYAPEPLQSMTSYLELPSPNLSSKVLVDYCIARLYEKAYKPERASYFLQAYENGVTAWLNAVSKRRGDYPDTIPEMFSGVEFDVIL